MLKIECSDLSKKFIYEWVFKGLNYSFDSGQSYAFTGPNGSGKSTLAQTITGYFTPSSGRISYYKDDQEIPVDEVFRQLTFASPYMELIEEFTLDEMLKFHFKFKEPLEGLDINNLKEMMNLDGVSKKQVKNFSSGMKQRLKLGLAFFSKSTLLILDEPTTNLDSAGVDWYLSQIDKFCKNRLVIVCSNLEREYQFCDHTINLSDWK
ncbi:MAG: ABC transporter ATP-binding protein [Bacteroidetes bacterium]|nr:ABC transporter ATP-binding protein [Bacteroidota bacterium]MDA1119379.1 ABC transporter ATP-binding protein [Bacteroidota bacterium]